VNEPEFLTVEDVLELHARSLDRFGGGEGIRDRGLLESAVAAPQAGFGGQFAHSDLYEMAAAYAFHIAQNQPFVDGNKRAGLGAALVFLVSRNGGWTKPDWRRSSARWQGRDALPPLGVSAGSP
jgi:death-on-curing protein